MLAEPEPAPASEVRPDLQAELAERFMERPKREEAPPPREQVPPAIDDRLASLTGIFAPGPAANAPPAPPPASAAEPAPPPAPDDAWAASPPPSQSSTASWMTPSPAASEAPANAWAPTTRDAQAEAEPWSGSAAPETHAPPSLGRDEWAAAQPTAEAPPEKKRGGFLSRFRKEEPPAAAVTRMPAASVASKGGLLASLSNALLVEYGSYGKGKIETRMANLLMRVDEQTDPIDRPLPIVDDLIDATALEREGVAEEQSVPYLAALVRQIYEDAERAFGKDKAKKGYKAAQQQVFGNDNILQSPDLAGKLPKV
jgi:hypothetical protein